MEIPPHPKIYHIVHYDRLASIIADSCLWSDAHSRLRNSTGTIIGDPGIKEARLTKRLLTYPELCVGNCVPFYFCPRSVMLYRLMRSNYRGQSYTGGEVPVVHLEADFHTSVKWAADNRKKWVLTTENARSKSAEDYDSINAIEKLNWDAIKNKTWGYQGVDPAVKSHKQSEFLMEESFPWHLIERIGIHPRMEARHINAVLTSSTHRPPVEFMKDWYYD